MFRRLEISPRVAPEELLIYAVLETLATQPEPIVDMLTEIVVIYNRMADMRRQYGILFFTYICVYMLHLYGLIIAVG